MGALQNCVLLKKGTVSPAKNADSVQKNLVWHERSKPLKLNDLMFGFQSESDSTSGYMCTIGHIHTHTHTGLNYTDSCPHVI